MTSAQPLQEVLPKAGLVVSEKGQLTEVLCKPKILPLKSVTLERIQQMEVRGDTSDVNSKVDPDQSLWTRCFDSGVQARVQHTNEGQARAASQ